jgi:hypothetical protein
MKAVIVLVSCFLSIAVHAQTKSPLRTDDDGARALLERLKECIGRADEDLCIDTQFAASLALMDKSLTAARIRVSQRYGAHSLLRLNAEQEQFEETVRHECKIRGLFGPEGLFNLVPSKKLCVSRLTIWRIRALAYQGS